MKNNNRFNTAQSIEAIKESIRDALGLDVPPVMLTETQTATVLTRKATSLRTARCTGINSPPFVKVGKSVRYPVDLLIQWILEATYLSCGEHQTHGGA